MKIRVDGFGKEEAKFHIKRAASAGFDVVVRPEIADVYIVGPHAEHSTIEQAEAQENARIIRITNSVDPKNINLKEVYQIEEKRQTEACRQAPPSSNFRAFITTNRIVVAVSLVIVLTLAVGAALETKENTGRFAYKADFSTKTFHLAECPHVQLMLDKGGKIRYTDDYDYLIFMGLRPCKTCLDMKKINKKNTSMKLKDAP